MARQINRNYVGKEINTNKKVYTRAYGIPVNHKDVKSDLRSGYMDEGKPKEQGRTDDFEVRLHFKEQEQDIENVILSILKETFIRNHLEAKEKNL